MVVSPRASVHIRLFSSYCNENTSTVPTVATLHDTAHRYGASASVLAARRAFFAALAAAAFAFFASAFAAYINHR
jgi:hypothetical protein